MSDKAWFFHFSGEALGPFSTATLTKMISQNRCSGGDFVWCEGMDGWTRVTDCGEFDTALPTTPKIATPSGTTTAAPTKLKAVPAPAPAPKAAPAAAAPAPKKAEAPKPAKAAPAPAPEPEAEAKPTKRMWRVPIDATVKINGGTPCKVLDISEGGLLFEKSSAMDMGADVKLRVESPSLGKPLDLTAVIVRDDTVEGKAALGVEFTRMNPAHKRVIAQYVADKLDLGAGSKAA